MLSFTWFPKFMVKSMQSDAMRLLELNLLLELKSVQQPLQWRLKAPSGFAETTSVSGSGGVGKADRAFQGKYFPCWDLGNSRENLSPPLRAEVAERSLSKTPLLPQDKLFCMQCVFALLNNCHWEFCQGLYHWDPSVSQLTATSSIPVSVTAPFKHWVELISDHCISGLLPLSWF